MLTNDDLSAIHKLVREEIQGSEKRLGDKIDKVQETVDIIQNVMVVHHDTLEKRVINVEKELHITGN